MKEKIFKKCLKCGALVEVLENDNNFICCGEQMVVVQPNSVEASFEKHIPEVHVENDNMVIRVNHVMEKEHYIKWIMIVTDKEVQKFEFKPGDEAVVAISCNTSALIYSYCNLHGLWLKKVDL